MTNVKVLDLTNCSLVERQNLFLKDVLLLEDGQKLEIISKTPVDDLAAELNRRANGEYLMNVPESGPTQWRLSVKKAGGCCGCCCE